MLQSSARHIGVRSQLQTARSALRFYHSSSSNSSAVTNSRRTVTLTTRARIGIVASMTRATIARCFSTVASTSPLASTPASASTIASPRAGGWLCPLPDECVLRVSAATNATTPLELLKYIHNLATIDVYSMVSTGSANSNAAASGPSEGFAHFLNARGRVLFEACFSPIDTASIHWLSLGARPGTLVQRGAAGIDREGAMVATNTSEFPKEFATISTTPRGFYLTLPKASKDIALAHLRQFNLRRKVVIEDVSESVQVSQAIPFSIIEEIQQPATTSSTIPHTITQILGLSSDTESDVSKQLNCLHAMIDPRCRSIGIRILTRKGTMRQ